jgi:hypothetical protein
MAGGRHILIGHADTESADFPSTTITGLDDSSRQFTQLYADGRGVFRVYQMRFQDGVWEVWRDAPDFFQRFNGIVSEDGNTISAYWDFGSCPGTVPTWYPPTNRAGRGRLKKTIASTLIPKQVWTSRLSGQLQCLKGRPASDCRTSYRARGSMSTPLFDTLGAEPIDGSRNHGHAA